MFGGRHYPLYKHLPANYDVNTWQHFAGYSLLHSNIIAAHCNNHIIHNYAKHALKVMSFDIENVVLKIFRKFFNSAKKRKTLKECFEFCESDFREVIMHVPIQWLSLFKAVDRVILSWRPIKSYFLAL
jgi:hypothetical protein